MCRIGLFLFNHINPVHQLFAPFSLQSVGRRRLALRLLEEERSAAQQVPLLLSLAVGGRQQQQQARNGGRQGMLSMDEWTRGGTPRGDLPVPYCIAPNPRVGSVLMVCSLGERLSDHLAAERMVGRTPDAFALL